jgi:hypothetical protein
MQNVQVVLGEGLRGYESGAVVTDKGTVLSASLSHSMSLCLFVV